MLLLVSRIRFGRWFSHAPSGLLYGAFTVGFAALAVAGAVKGDLLVFGLGLMFALIGAALWLAIPRLSWSLSEERSREPEG
jgi:hypothetical protein